MTRHRRNFSRPVFKLVFFSVLFLLFSTQGSVIAVNAQTEPPGSPAPRTDIPNETCLGCHGQPGLTLPLQNGEPLNLHVPLEEYASSIHGELNIACVQCHTNVGNYPHPPFTAEDRRDASLQQSGLCQTCHADLYELEHDSVHARALAEGNRNAAICTDCHTAHAVRRLTPPGSEPEVDARTNLQIPQLLPEARVWVADTCSQCHYAIFEKYQESVHGAALIEEGNPDVPTCIHCHGVHNIEDPNTASFRLRSPQICARCHTDASIMDKYGISTQVLETYVADFHGTTVTLFEKQSPEQETNKPVCYDCHGIHDIAATTDPEKGLKVKANILARCQECHPQASINFPDAWLSHYIPSPNRYPLVFTVNAFYSIFIPLVLGPMALLVALDLNKSLQLRRKRRAAAQPVQADETHPDVTHPEAPVEAVAVFPPEPEPAELSSEDLNEIQEPGAANEAEPEPREPEESPEDSPGPNEPPADETSLPDETNSEDGPDTDHGRNEL